MKDSILNIKNILRIIISVLIIFSMLKSCAKADVYTDTRNEIRDKIKILCEKGAYGIGQYAYETINLAEIYATNYFIIIGKGNNNSYNGQLNTDYRIYIGEIRSNVTITNQTNDTNNALYNNWTGITNTHQYYLNGNKINKGSIPLNNLLQPFYCYTTVPINTRVLSLGAEEEYGGSYIISTFEFTPTGEQVTFQNETVQGIKKDNLVIPFNLGNIEDRDLYYNFIISISTNGQILDTLNYYTEYNENSNKNYHQGMLSVTTNNNKTYILLSSPRLNFNQKYTLSIDVYTDSQTHEVYNYNYVFLHQNATISNGVITNYGSGDFTNQDIAISNQQNAENSNNMLQDLYNKAFSISGDYIQNKIEELKLNNNFSGDIEIEKAFIGLLSGDNQDFKISWNQVATHFTYGNYGENTSQVIIPSGEVNFSKIERENEEFQEVMNWVRIILGFSFGAMLLRNYWTTLLETLGIGIQPYDSVKEEKAIMTDTIIEDAKGEKTRQVRVTKGNKTYIKKYKMNNYKQIGGE